eukprot:312174-Prymnesium_polylepis.2
MAATAASRNPRITARRRCALAAASDPNLASTKSSIMRLSADANASACATSRASTDLRTSSCTARSHVPQPTRIWSASIGVSATSYTHHERMKGSTGSSAGQTTHVRPMEAIARRTSADVSASHAAAEAAGWWRATRSIQSESASGGGRRSQTEPSHGCETKTVGRCVRCSRGTKK